jgi:[acyl-carrier-protein] S-malonyltransferase
VEEVETAVSAKLAQLVSDGPIEELTKTENVQPAIFMVSMACVRILEKEYGYVVKKRCKFLAGHSLGEYAALCTAGVFSVADAAKMVRKRGELMAEQTRCDRDTYCMTALLGVGAQDIEDIILQRNSGDGVCVIANDNSPSEVVVSGHKASIRCVVDDVKKNISDARAIELNTSGPFHSPLMARAAMDFDGYLSENHRFNNPEVPVIMNIDAKPLTKKEQAHEYLVRQMVGRVLWRETSDLLVKDPEVHNIAEIQPGRILTKMMKRTYADARITALETVLQMEEFAKGA